MKQTPLSKVICVHHRLAAYSSHHYNESLGFIRDFARRGREFILLGNVHAPASIVAELGARPVLDDPTFQMQWSFDERSRRFVGMLHENVDGLLAADDWVFLTIATQLEAYALVCWLQQLPEAKRPWITILFLSDRWNRSDRKEYERQVAEFDILKTAIAGLGPSLSRRVIFLTLTDLLAEELTALLGTRVDVAPMPLDYADPKMQGSRVDSGIPRIAIPGGTRGEKGSRLIPDIVRACRSHVNVEFLVHLANNNLDAQDVERLTSLSREPGVIAIHGEMTLPEYETALSSADIALFPYEVIPYRKRTSGVFGEAVAFGIPTVVTPGAWLAEQIGAGRAAGIISADLQPDSIARAIANCVAQLERLQPLARSLSSAWRKNISLPAFVDLVERKIALRAQSEKQRRWMFWSRRARATRIEEPTLTTHLWD